MKRSSISRWILRDRVQAAADEAGRGQGEIDPFGIEPLGKSVGRERRFLRAPAPDSRSCFRRVQQLADAGALLRRKLAEVLADFGERAFAAEHLDANRFEIFRRGGNRNSGECAIARPVYNTIDRICFGHYYAAP